MSNNNGCYDYAALGLLFQYLTFYLNKQNILDDSNIMPSTNHL